MRPRNHPIPAARRVRMSLLGVLAVGLVGLGACTTVSHPSPLAYGYVYWDFKNVDNQTLAGVPADLAGKTTVYATLDKVGSAVFVELWCYGVKVQSGSSYLYNLGRGVAEAQFAFVNPSSVCTVREHVPNTWPRANYYLRVDKDAGGKVTAAAILLQHL